MGLTKPLGPEELFAHLRGLGIVTQTYRHPPVFTVVEAKRLRGDLPGGHCKSLLLRDRARALWLVVALEHRRIDLKRLRRELGAKKNLSFASPELLLEVLGVEPGAVSPFGLINDRDSRVQVVLDRGMLDVNPLNYHPLRNDRTTAIASEDLLRFLASLDRSPRLIDFDNSSSVD